MEILKMVPALKDYIWGGTKLVTKWGKKAEGKVAESWELSTHRDGPSGIDGRPKVTLRDVVNAENMGSNCWGLDRFPVLIKLIDAEQKLSVQVHPADEYALVREGDLGKTEMWYIADCEEGSGIYLGFSRDVSKEEVERAIADGSIEGLLNFIPVKKGDSFLIEAGTIHTICAGVTICEIQQNSNVTYRVYDYNRVDKSGRKRKLHVEKALDVLSFKKYLPRGRKEDNVLASCKYFTVEERSFSGKEELFCGGSSFNAVSVLEGKGDIEGISFRKGDTFFVPAGYGRYSLSGEGLFLLTRV